MPQKQRFVLAAVLPDVAEDEDPCVLRLLGGLEESRGVTRVHLLSAPDAAGDLCVHYDDAALSGAELERAVWVQGDVLTRRFGHLRCRIEVADSATALRELAEHLRSTDGVVETRLMSDFVSVEFDRDVVDESLMRQALSRPGVLLDAPRESLVEGPPDGRPGIAEDDARSSGTPDSDHHDHDHGHSHGGMAAVFGERTELIFALLAGAGVLIGLLLEQLTSVASAVPIAFFLLAYIFGGSLTVREAIGTIRAGRFDIEFLMLVAAAGAAVLGRFFEGGLLLFLFSLGHSLEHYAMGRAKRAIEALGELAPRTATVRRNGQEQEVGVEHLEVGDTVIVRPDARIPADGFVTEGESSVDQAPITGESIPVDKRPVDDAGAASSAVVRIAAHSRVFAGTINGGGALEVRVTAPARDNTLARVVQLVSQAETGKSSTQRFTDRFERYFVPTVIGFVALLVLSPLVTGEDFSDAFYRAMAVLVAASPCALAIATPSAVLSAVARAGRSGVLVKGGAPLEALGTLRAIAFDKTGTLTEGTPRLTDVVAYGNASASKLLEVAVAVERLSDHPIAAAIVRDGLKRGQEPTGIAQNLESITGRGVRADIDGQVVYVGKDQLFDEVRGMPLPQRLREDVDRLESEGRTTMIVRRGDDYLGVLGVMDKPRRSVGLVITELRRIGIRRMIMISGDNQLVATAVADEVGLDAAWGDLMPEHKVDAIRNLREQEGKVAMVGDGVNDAPAMAAATVSIAMGAAGSQVALETADIALMADDLTRLPFAVDLSRASTRIIRQNLMASLGVVVLLIPATVLGLGIGPAVFFHEGSTLLVVGNALRLLAYGKNA